MRAAVRREDTLEVGPFLYRFSAVRLSLPDPELLGRGV